jgi:hypothetical protein
MQTIDFMGHKVLAFERPRSVCRSDGPGESDFIPDLSKERLWSMVCATRLWVTEVQTLCDRLYLYCKIETLGVSLQMTRTSGSDYII